MTDEELASLMQEISGQIDSLSKPEEPLTRKEEKRKSILHLEMEALKRVKTAKENGNFKQEVRAGLDYTLLTKYGEKHPLLMGFIRSRMWFLGL
jgi:hypothetical protein